MNAARINLIDWHGTASSPSPASRAGGRTP
jgi:hypothetical protein